jgi:hypothetical protein
MCHPERSRGVSRACIKSLSRPETVERSFDSAGAPLKMTGGASNCCLAPILAISRLPRG